MSEELGDELHGARAISAMLAAIRQGTWLLGRSVQLSCEGAPEDTTLAPGPKACDLAAVAGRSVQWTGEHDFTVDGVRYRSMAKGGDADQLTVLKDHWQVDFYESLIARTRPRRIVEAGIYGGGSTALLAQLAQPEKLLAFDLRTRCPDLDEFIEEQGLQGVVAPHYGINQADTAQLDRIMAAEFDGAPVDLVIDDASHLLGETRATFDSLFPHLRPDGLYVIEDWSWAHQPRWFGQTDTAYQAVPPLSTLVCELVLAAACRPKVIAEVVVDYHGVQVRRGPADLDPAKFRLSSRLDPVARDMVDRLEPARSLPDY